MSRASKGPRTDRCRKWAWDSGPHPSSCSPASRTPQQAVVQVPPVTVDLYISQFLLLLVMMINHNSSNFNHPSTALCNVGEQSPSHQLMPSVPILPSMKHQWGHPLQRLMRRVEENLCAECLARSRWSAFSNPRASSPHATA